jgi:hypothetical protein
VGEEKKVQSSSSKGLGWGQVYTWPWRKVVADLFIHSFRLLMSTYYPSSPAMKVHHARWLSKIQT